MPNVIENMMVGLGFDNAQFEKGVSQSLGTLDKLKNALTLKGADAGINTIQNGLSNLTFGSIEKGLQVVTQGFSAWEQIAIGALRNIGSRAVDLGETLIQKLGIQQMQAGWGKYVDITSSVQTIMSSMPELGIEKVSDEVEALRWFTDETSFSLTDMTSNIAKFTAAGIDLDKATDAMFGIAAASGAAGVDVKKASHAMEGFSKAMGAGYMRTQDWMWIQTSGLANSLEFKQSLLDAAVATDQLVISNGKYWARDGKGWEEVTAENLQQSLHTKWLDKATLTKALNEYGSFSRKMQQFYVAVGNGSEYTSAKLLDFINAYKESGKEFKVEGEGLAEISEKTGLSIEELGKWFETLASQSEKGLNGFTKAMEAISFKQAIDALNDALSSQWSQSFELIFGNYEQQKVLWTNFANWLNELFASSAYSRNEMLEEWNKNGGYDAFTNSLYNIMDALISIKETISEIIDTFIPDINADRLVEWTQRFEAFTANIKTNVKKIGEYWEELKEYYGIDRDRSVIPTRSDNRIRESLYEGEIVTPGESKEGVEHYLLEPKSKTELSEGAKRLQTVYLILESINKTATLVERIWNRLSKVFSPLGKGIRTLTNDIILLGGAIAKRITSVMEYLTGKAGLTDFFSRFTEEGSGVIETAINLIHRFLVALTELIDPDIDKTTGGFLSDIWSVIKDLGTALRDIVEALAPVLGYAWDVFKEVLKGLGEAIHDFFDDFSLDNAAISARSIIDLIIAFLSVKIFGNLSGASQKIAELKQKYKDKGLMGTLLDIITGNGKEAEDGEKKQKWYDGILKGFESFTDKIFGVVNKYTNMNTLKEFANSVLKIALSIVALAIIPADKVDTAIRSILLIFSGIGAIIASMKFMKFSKEQAAAIASFGGMFTGLATAFATLAGALFILSFRDGEKVAIAAAALVGSLISIMLLLGNLLEAVDGEHITTGKIIAIGVALTGIGLALDLVALAMAGLSFIDPVGLLKSFFAMFAMLMTITTALMMLSSVDSSGRKILSAGASVLLIATALDMIALAIAGLSFIDGTKTFIAALELASAFAVIAMALGGLASVTNGVDLVLTASALLIISPALLILSGALIALAQIPFLKLLSGLGAIAIGLTLITAAGIFATAIVPGLMALAATFVAMGLAAVGIGLGIGIAALGVSAGVAIISGSISGLLEGIGGAISWVKEKVGGVLDWFRGRSEEAAQEVDYVIQLFPSEETGDESGEGFAIGWNNGAFNNIDPQGLMDQVKQVLGDDAPALGLTAEDLANVFSGELTNGMVSADYGGVMDNIAQAIYNKIPALESAGYSAGYSAGAATERGYRDATAVRSPSRVFMRLMDYIAEGITIGADRNLESIYSVGTSMGNALIMSTEDALSPLSDYNYNVSPSISPVLDMSGVGAGSLSFGATLTPGAARNLASVSADIRDQRDSMNDYIDQAVTSAINGMRDELTFVVPLEVDGRQFAASTARFTRSELNLMDRNAMRKGGLINA